MHPRANGGRGRHVADRPGMVCTSPEVDRMQVGEAMVAQMVRWGIQDIFGLSGSSILPLLDALR